MAPLAIIKKESKEIKGKIKNQTLSYITAGFGLVAGLAWNEAIKSSIDYIFPISKNTLIAKFGYAALMTLVVALIAVYLARILREKKD